MAVKFRYGRLKGRKIKHIARRRYPALSNAVRPNISQLLLETVETRHPLRRVEFVLQSEFVHDLHPRGWAISGREVVRESLYEVWLNRKSTQLPSYLRYKFIRHSKKTQRYDEPICLFYGAPNYWHFHNDLVYPLLLAADCGLTADRAIIVPEVWREQSFFHAALENSSFLRSLNWVFQDRNSVLQVERPIFISTAFAWPEGFVRAAQEVAPLLPCEGERNFRSRIYVTRSGVSREASNEAEIRGLLDRFGFEVVDCALLTLNEQVAVFRKAEMIVALHGAALANLAHVSRSGIPILEIVPRNWLNPCYLWMAQHQGMDYTGQVSTSCELSTDGRTIVDIGQIVQWLRKVAA